METFLFYFMFVLFYLFKSYYVVWKLFLSPFVSSHHMLFKSYYVVWKPYFPHIFFFFVVSGLNRTMQYGNYILSPRALYCFFSLNRTMQYGNYAYREFPIFHHSRLNRTMQYGNFFYTPKLSSSHMMFKSYYVVWKQKKYISFRCSVYSV